MTEKTFTIHANSAPKLKLRSKFSRKFIRLPKTTQERLYSIIQNFAFNLDDFKATEILWKLTYNQFSGLSALGIREQNPHLNDDILVLEPHDVSEHYENSHPVEIPHDIVSTLKNELRYQRKQLNPNFLKIECSESCKKSFTALANVTNNPVITYVIYRHCYEFCYFADSNDISRVLYLLSSKKEKYHFGGIRSLHFTQEQAMLLMPYTSELHDYIEASWNEILAERTATELPSVGTLAGQLETWLQAPDNATSNDVTAVTVNEVVAEPIDDTFKSQISCLKSALTVQTLTERPVSTRNILADCDLFAKFVSIVQDKGFANSFAEFTKTVKDLKNHGYDYNSVIEMLPKIEVLLDCKTILEGA